MNKSIEIAAMILGSISLLTVCFLGFAVMSGVPLHQVAIIGSLFPEPVERAAEVDPNGAPTVDPSDEPSDEEIIAQGVGIVASSFVLPSPYDAVELKGLTDELKMRRQQLNAREEGLDDREDRIDERESAATARFAALDDLRSQLDEFQQELLMRELEVAREEDGAKERSDAKWTRLGNLIASLTMERRKEFLIGYEPEDVAQILRTLEVDDAAKTLEALTDKDADPGRTKAIVDAYAEAVDE